MCVGIKKERGNQLLFDCNPLSISPSKQPSSSLPSCFRSMTWRNFFKSLPTSRTSGSFKRIHANFSCSVVGIDCWVGDRLLELDFDGLLVWSVVYSPRALVIFSWTSSIKLDSVTPWTSRQRRQMRFGWPSSSLRQVWHDSSTLFLLLLLEGNFQRWEYSRLHDSSHAY